MNTTTLSFVKKEEIANNILSLLFKKPDNFVFDAGQFIQFLIDEHGTTHKRAYSIASAPQDTHIEYIAKLWPDGKASSLFQSLEPGDTCTITGPFGHFTNKADTPLILVGTGTGLAPLLGILSEYLTYADGKKPVHLLVGFREEQCVFKEEALKQLAKKHKNFTYTITLSQPKHTDNAYTTGRVTAHISQHIDTNARYMLCGSPPMVKEVRGMLLTHDIAPKNIAFEIY